MKFYAGSHGNKTIVNTDGKISADIAVSCDGNSATATRLKDAVTIGGVSFDGSTSIDLPGVNTAGTQNTSGKADTAGTADKAKALEDGSTITIGSTIYNIDIKQITDKND